MKELLGRDGQVIHVSLKTNPVDKVASTASSIEEQFFDTAEDLPLKTFVHKGPILSNNEVEILMTLIQNLATGLKI